MGCESQQYVTLVLRDNTNTCFKISSDRILIVLHSLSKSIHYQHYKEINVAILHLIFCQRLCCAIYCSATAYRFGSLEACDCHLLCCHVDYEDETIDMIAHRTTSCATSGRRKKSLFSVVFSSNSCMSDT